MKRWIAFCLLVSLCAGVCLPVTADDGKTVSTEYAAADLTTPLEDSAPAAAGTRLEIAAKSAVLMEPVTGRILYEDNPDERLAPASITKIMSLLLVVEAIEAGKISLDTPVTASEHACSMGGSQIWLEPGETMTVDELLKAAVIASANDATVALGEAVAGSEESFVQRMNERAKALGMDRTTFCNCTGLDAEGHLTTAHDVAVMACQLIRHDLIRNYSTVWMDTLRDGKSELVNTNKLVRFYPGTTGLKTGTTGTAGHCLAATAERDGLGLCAVILGGATSNDRFNGAKKLLDYGFANWAFATVEADLSAAPPVPVRRGVSKSVAPAAGEALQVLVPKGRAGDVTRQVELVEGLDAPVLPGQSLGRVRVALDGAELGSIPLYAAEGVEALGFLVALRWLFSGLFHL